MKRTLGLALALSFAACASSGNRMPASVSLKDPVEIERQAYRQLLNELASRTLSEQTVVKAFAHYLVRPVVLDQVGTFQCVMPGFVRLEDNWASFPEWLHRDLRAMRVPGETRDLLRRTFDKLEAQASFRQSLFEDARATLLSGQQRQQARRLAQLPTDKGGDNDRRDAERERLEANQKQLAAWSKSNYLRISQSEIEPYMQAEGLYCTEQFLEPLARFRSPPDGSAAGRAH